MTSSRHKSRSRSRLEEFESVDDSVRKSQLGNSNITPTSYDILGQSCGCPAATLGNAARIRRLKPTCRVYRDIDKYVKNSSDGNNISTKTVYKIERYGEREPFEETYRLMLWHGTNPAAIAGIIQNGFRMGTSGAMGGGIYFADRIAKSLHFTSKTGSGTGFFILAEVAPGKVYKAHHAHTTYTSAPTRFDTVKWTGSKIPDWNQNKHYFGAILPCGTTIQNTRHSQYDVTYNEYIVYDVNKLVIRFIIECNI